MRIPTESPLVISNGFKIPHTSHHLPRHSTSSTGSSPVDSIGHLGQMTASNAFGELGVGSDHSGFPDSNHSVLGLANGLGGAHSSAQPLVRTSENYVAISLPPVSELQLTPIEESVRESVREAVLLLDSGKLEDAETFLDHATKTLQWLRGCRP